MKPFDISLANAGHKVQTRSGRSARIICYDRDFQNADGDSFPIIALVRHEKHELPYPYTIDGHLFADGKENDFDLVMKPKNCVRWVNVYRDRKTGRVHTGDVYDTEDEAQHQILCLDNTEHITIQKIEWEE